MTDMYREAFERLCEQRGIATSPEHRTYEYEQAYEDWQAALRYRDERDCQSPEIFPGTLGRLESLSIRKGVTK